MRVETPHVALVALLFVTGLAAVVFGQERTSAKLPETVALTDIEMTLQVGGGGGCVGRCSRYRVVVQGSGTIRFQDLGAEPRPRDRERAVSVEDALALLNEFLHAGMADAAPSYVGVPNARRDGDRVVVSMSGGADGPEWDLSLRLGDYRKTVHLYLGYPAELARVRDQMIRLGEPSAWPPN